MKKQLKLFSLLSSKSRISTITSWASQANAYITLYYDVIIRKVLRTFFLLFLLHRRILCRNPNIVFLSLSLSVCGYVFPSFSSFSLPFFVSLPFSFSIPNTLNIHLAVDGKEKTFFIHHAPWRSFYNSFRWMVPNTVLISVQQKLFLSNEVLMGFYFTYLSSHQ